MKTIIEHWDALVYISCVIALVIYKLQQWRNLDQSAKDEAIAEAADSIRQAVKDWLLRAVIEAEAEFGSETGKLKIRYVYERMIEIFGEVAAQYISLEELDAMAQLPLAEMRRLLESNGAIADYVAPKNSVNAIGFEVYDPEEYEEDDE